LDGTEWTTDAMTLSMQLGVVYRRDERDREPTGDR
jgi:hypothetical protein